MLPLILAALAAAYLMKSSPSKAKALTPPEPRTDAQTPPGFTPEQIERVYAEALFAAVNSSDLKAETREAIARFFGSHGHVDLGDALLPDVVAEIGVEDPGGTRAALREAAIIEDKAAAFIAISEALESESYLEDDVMKLQETMATAIAEADRNIASAVFAKSQGLPVPAGTASAAA